MFQLVPSWRVTAAMPETQEGESALAQPTYLALTVADGDLEAVLRAVKRSGYEQVTFERQYPFTGLHQTTSNGLQTVAPERSASGGSGPDTETAK